MGNNILEIDSIQKRIKNEIILSDIYIRCETGNIIGLLGRNGSGKSTLFKIILGLEQCDYKFIRINNVVKNKVFEIISEIGYLPQENYIPGHLSVKKAISLSIDKIQLNNFINDNFINDIYKKFVHELSGGELRYLEIKILLFSKKKFLLLDEPYNGLSPISIESINNLILYNSKRKGIIITDHNYVEINKISNKIILLKDGKTFNICNLSELVEKGYINNI